MSVPDLLPPGHKPDYRRLQKVLTRSGLPDRVPFYELFIEDTMVERMTGERLSPAAEVGLYYRLGHDYCNFPPEAKTKPRVGTFLEPDYERILSLKPDLVLVIKNPVQVTARLRSFGLNAEDVDMDNVQSVLSATLQIARLTGRAAEGQRLADSLKRQLDEVKKAGSKGGATSKTGSSVRSVIRRSVSRKIISGCSGRFASHRRSISRLSRPPLRGSAIMRPASERSAPKESVTSCRGC
mgnify:CR=1 FL=1